MKIQTLEINGFVSCLESLRLPFKKEVRSQHSYCTPYIKENKIFSTGMCISLNEKDLLLLQTLIRRGDEHAKAVRLIKVDCKIQGPLFFWNELDTYEIGVTNGCSESTMHTLKKEKLTINNFEYPISQDIINHIQDKIDDDITIEDIKNILPSGYLQERVISFSYQTLRRIVKQRCINKHKLPQWEIFGNWVKTLPLAKELILIE